jgi:hypothetical protein
MPGSITADVLAKRPLELAVRAVLAFGIALWLSIRLSPILFDALLPFYEHAVHLLDDHYRIDLALTHQTGHDKIGSDLVLLVRATVARTFMVFGADTTVTLDPGEVLKSSTAIGVFMQPAVMILGLSLGWPVRSGREAAIRSALGATMLALWLVLGIPLSLWISFQDIPIQAYAPNEIPFASLLDKFMLNGGAVILGALLAAVAIATGHRWTAGAMA